MELILFYDKQKSCFWCKRAKNMQISLSKLVWIDGTAALLSAIVVLVLKSLLSEFLNIPLNLLVLMCIVSFLYAAYSISLALLKEKPVYRIKILITGNIIWSLLCLIFILLQFKTINVFGIIYLSSESIFVAGLAWFEYKQLKLIK